MSLNSAYEICGIKIRNKPMVFDALITKHLGESYLYPFILAFRLQIVLICLETKSTAWIIDYLQVMLHR
jgi:hypothetical protein